MPGLTPYPDMPWPRMSFRRERSAGPGGRGGRPRKGRPPRFLPPDCGQKRQRPGQPGCGLCYPATYLGRRGFCASGGTCVSLSARPGGGHACPRQHGRRGGAEGDSLRLSRHGRARGGEPGTILAGWANPRTISAATARCRRFSRNSHEHHVNLLPRCGPGVRALGHHGAPGARNSCVLVVAGGSHFGYERTCLRARHALGSVK